MTLTASSFRLTEDQRQIYRDYARLALPRHTSYPIAPLWRESYGPARFRDDLAAAAPPWSLYVHIPYCEKLCYYCACTREIIPAARRRLVDPTGPLLAGFVREAARFHEIVGRVPVHQVHWGGGSPTFLDPGQLEQLWQTLASHFDIQPEAEAAIEIDPRITTLEQLQALRSLGFQRISIGVQDFAPQVQRAVNRLQSFEVVERVVTWARALGFSSVNFDLIYGLPFQTLDSMADTLDQAIALNPDRIAFYRLAIVPEMFRWQKVFRAEDLPGGDVPLDLNLLAIQRFEEAGYEFIGLDHFARPDEALALARRAGTLHRNFQGMTTGKHLQLLGLGPSAISQLTSALAQNHKTTAAWLQALDAGLATERGWSLSQDDIVRREVLQQLYGHGAIERRSLEAAFAIDFDAYFASELDRLRTLESQGIVELDPRSIRLTPLLGRLLVRVVAAVFDRYLPPQAYREGLPAGGSSKVG